MLAHDADTGPGPGQVLHLLRAHATRTGQATVSARDLVNGAADILATPRTRASLNRAASLPGPPPPPFFARRAAQGAGPREPFANHEEVLAGRHRPAGPAPLGPLYASAHRPARTAPAAGGAV
jgi:hypothetical protein